MELDEEVVTRVVPGSAAFDKGVQCGWRILKIDSQWVRPNEVLTKLQSISKLVLKKGFTVTFSNIITWSPEIQGFVMKKLLQKENWREAILSACTLTRKMFKGSFVQEELNGYVEGKKAELFSGSENALGFLSKLCFTGDSLMSRTILAKLDDEVHGDIISSLTLYAKKYFLSMESLQTTETPAICILFSRLFKLSPSEQRKFYPGRALNVWFRGVDLSFLQMIQRKIDRSWTTEEVKNKFVLGQTISTDTKLMADMASPAQRGPASIFISHAWRNRYFDLVEACTKYPRHFFFNDIIAIQQHKIKSDDMMQDLKALPLIISYSACCLLISDMKLLPLSRIWCLFELYHCLVTTKSELIVEFTSEGLDEKSDNDLWTLSTEIDKRIDSIDVKKANATVEEDKVRILGEIEANVPGGTDQFNFQLKTALKNEWAVRIREKWGWKMMETFGRAVQKVKTLEMELASVKGTLATVLTRLEKIESQAFNSSLNSNDIPRAI